MLATFVIGSRGVVQWYLFSFQWRTTLSSNVEDYIPLFSAVLSSAFWLQCWANIKRQGAERGIAGACNIECMRASLIMLKWPHDSTFVCNHHGLTNPFNPNMNTVWHTNKVINVICHTGSATVVIENGIPVSVKRARGWCIWSLSHGIGNLSFSICNCCADKNRQPGWQTFHLP